MEVLEGINGVAGERLSLSASEHGNAEFLPPWFVTVRWNAMGVGGLHETRNGRAIPCLSCSNQCSQTIHVRMVNIDVVTGTHKV